MAILLQLQHRPNKDPMVLLLLLLLCLSQTECYLPTEVMMRIYHLLRKHRRRRMDFEPLKAQSESALRLHRFLDAIAVAVHSLRRPILDLVQLCAEKQKGKYNENLNPNPNHQSLAKREEVALRCVRQWKTTKPLLLVNAERLLHPLEPVARRRPVAAVMLTLMDWMVTCLISG
jgi:predicted nucleic acid-binding protein